MYFSPVPVPEGVFLSPQVVVPMVGNTRNHKQWPTVVSQDVLKHTGGLKGDVLVLSGQVKGKTFLPLPRQSDLIEVTCIEDLE